MALSSAALVRANGADAAWVRVNGVQVWGDSGGGPGPDPDPGTAAWFGPAAPTTLAAWAAAVGATAPGQGRFGLEVRPAYSWLHSTPANATGRTSRAVDPRWPTAAASSDGGFLWYLDGNNYVGFVVSGSTVYLRQRVAGVNDQTTTAYTPDPTYAWDLIHDTDTDQIVWGQWRDGTFTELRRAARTLDITNVMLRAYAGTWATSTGELNIGGINTGAPTTAPPVPPEPPQEPTDPDPEPEPGTGTLVSLDGSGSAATWSYSNRTDASVLFYVNNGQIERTGTLFRQPSQSQFRAWWKQAYGGPAQPRVRMKVRARVTALGGTDGGIIEGLKLMVKSVHPEHPQGILDPDAARGIQPWNIGPGGKSVTPGSMYAFALTRGGQVEISKHHYGEGTYTFGSNANRPFTMNQWYDLAMEVEWLTNPDRVRITSYRDGVQQLTWTDTGQTGVGTYDGGRPFMQPFFWGLRSDDAAFEFDDFVLETF